MVTYFTPLGSIHPAYIREVTVVDDEVSVECRVVRPYIPPTSKTVRELLYYSVFPEDPIADWGKAKIEAIIEKYKQKLRVYDEALLEHRLKDNVYYCTYAKMGGSGATASLSPNDMRKIVGLGGLV